MSKSKGGTVLAPVDLWPTWMARLGFPDMWEAIGGGHELKVEEFRDNGSMVVRAELPGIDPDKDVEVTMADGRLRIHAERTEQSDRHDDRTYRSEFRYGEFDRVLPLPTGTKADEVKASYRDGILEVRLPIAEAADVQKVEIARS
jgi:HSP20 family protein